MLGLELGADDYVTKPFSPRELRARIKAVLRRAADDAPGDLPLRRRRSGLRARGGAPQGRVVDVTPIEFKLLEAFVRRRGRVLTREQLLDAVWERGVHVTDRAVDAHIVNLRKKSSRRRPNRGFSSACAAGYRFDG